ncbi:MAG: DUF4326 domain-containing protein [Janthinobacterium lividum]
MPRNTVYVGRPGRWGNPFDTAAEFSAWLEGKKTNHCRSLDHRRHDILGAAPLLLHGKNLACWCGEGQDCHADFLLKIVNAPRA